MTLNAVDMVVGVSQCTGIFTTPQPSLGFTENVPKRGKIPSERQLWAGKCLVDDRGQRSELADWLETIEREQEVT